MADVVETVLSGTNAIQNAYAGMTEAAADKRKRRAASILGISDNLSKIGETFTQVAEEKETKSLMDAFGAAVTTGDPDAIKSAIGSMGGMKTQKGKKLQLELLMKSVEMGQERDKTAYEKARDAKMDAYRQADDERADRIERRQVDAYQEGLINTGLDNIRADENQKETLRLRNEAAAVRAAAAESKSSFAKYEAGLNQEFGETLLPGYVGPKGMSRTDLITQVALNRNNSPEYQAALSDLLDKARKMDEADIKMKVRLEEARKQEATQNRTFYLSQKDRAVKTAREKLRNAGSPEAREAMLPGLLQEIMSTEAVKLLRETNTIPDLDFQIAGELEAEAGKLSSFSEVDSLASAIQKELQTTYGTKLLTMSEEERRAAAVEAEAKIRRERGEKIPGEAPRPGAGVQLPFKEDPVPAPKGGAIQKIEEDGPQGGMDLPANAGEPLTEGGYSRKSQPDWVKEGYGGTKSATQLLRELDIKEAKEGKTFLSRLNRVLLSPRARYEEDFERTQNEGLNVDKSLATGTRAAGDIAAATIYAPGTAMIEGARQASKNIDRGVEKYGQFMVDAGKWVADKTGLETAGAVVETFGTDVAQGSIPKVGSALGKAGAKKLLGAVDFDQSVRRNPKMRWDDDKLYPSGDPSAQMSGSAGDGARRVQVPANAKFSSLADVQTFGVRQAVDRFLGETGSVSVDDFQALVDFQGKGSPPIKGLPYKPGNVIDANAVSQMYGVTDPAKAKKLADAFKTRAESDIVRRDWTAEGVQKDLGVDPQTASRIAEDYNRVGKGNQNAARTSAKEVLDALKSSDDTRAKIVGFLLEKKMQGEKPAEKGGKVELATKKPSKTKSPKVTKEEIAKFERLSADDIAMWHDSLVDPEVSTPPEVFEKLSPVKLTPEDLQNLYKIKVEEEIRTPGTELNDATQALMGDAAPKGSQEGTPATKKAVEAASPLDPIDQVQALVKQANDRADINDPIVQALSSEDGLFKLLDRGDEAINAAKVHLENLLGDDVAKEGRAIVTTKKDILSGKGGKSAEEGIGDGAPVKFRKQSLVDKADDAAGDAFLASKGEVVTEKPPVSRAGYKPKTTLSTDVATKRAEAKALREEWGSKVEQAVVDVLTKKAEGEPAPSGGPAKALTPLLTPQDYADILDATGAPPRAVAVALTGKSKVTGNLRKGMGLRRPGGAQGGFVDVGAIVEGVGRILASPYEETVGRLLNHYSKERVLQRQASKIIGRLPGIRAKLIDQADSLLRNSTPSPEMLDAFEKLKRAKPDAIARKVIDQLGDPDLSTLSQFKDRWVGGFVNLLQRTGSKPLIELADAVLQGSMIEKNILEPMNRDLVGLIRSFSADAQERMGRAQDTGDYSKLTYLERAVVSAVEEVNKSNWLMSNKRREVFNQKQIGRIDHYLAHIEKSKGDGRWVNRNQMDADFMSIYNPFANKRTKDARWDPSVHESYADTVEATLDAYGRDIAWGAPYAMAEILTGSEVDPNPLINRETREIIRSEMQRISGRRPKWFDKEVTNPAMKTLARIAESLAKKGGQGSEAAKAFGIKTADNARNFAEIAANQLNYVWRLAGSPATMFVNTLGGTLSTAWNVDTDVFARAFKDFTVVGRSAGMLGSVAAGATGFAMGDTAGAMAGGALAGSYLGYKVGEKVAKRLSDTELARRISSIADKVLGDSQSYTDIPQARSSAVVNKVAAVTNSYPLMGGFRASENLMANFAAYAGWLQAQKDLAAGTLKVPEGRKVQDVLSAQARMTAAKALNIGSDATDPQALAELGTAGRIGMPYMRYMTRLGDEVSAKFTGFLNNPKQNAKRFLGAGLIGTSLITAIYAAGIDAGSTLIDTPNLARNPVVLAGKALAESAEEGPARTGEGFGEYAQRRAEPTMLTRTLDYLGDSPRKVDTERGVYKTAQGKNTDIPADEKGRALRSMGFTPTEVTEGYKKSKIQGETLRSFDEAKYAYLEQAAQAIVEYKKNPSPEAKAAADAAIENAMKGSYDGLPFFEDSKGGSAMDKFMRSIEEAIANLSKTTTERMMQGRPDSQKVRLLEIRDGKKSELPLKQK